MRDVPADLTTVVVPAFNAAATIDETLRSVRAQTHEALEIIVADDGSSDATADIVRSHVRIDARVRLIQQANLGVAAARNAAIAAGRGAFIAPIDADDLWHPSKIEKQVAAMRQGGPRVGLVYTWFALIDAESRVTALGGRNLDSGDVLRPLCRSNFIGSGSNALMRTAAVHSAGGYDATLRQRSAEGCEDFRLSLAIARRLDFAVVPELLTGYRRLPTCMSNNLMQMLRSVNLVFDELLDRHPELATHIRDGRSNFYFSAYLRAKNSGRTDQAAHFLRQYIRSMPYHAFKAFVYRPLRDRARRWLRPTPPPGAHWIGRRFPFQDGG